MKLVAVLGGGDWCDASVNHILIPEDMNLEKEKQDREIWYEYTYRFEREHGKNPEYISFVDWLKQHGAMDATENEIIEFWDY